MLSEIIQVSGAVRCGSGKPSPISGGANGISGADTMGRKEKMMRNRGERIEVRKVEAGFSEPPFEGNEGMSNKLNFASVVSAIGFDQLKY